MFGGLSSSLLNLQFADHSVDNFVNDTQELLPVVCSLIHDFAGLFERHVDLNDDLAYLSKQVDRIHDLMVLVHVHLFGLFFLVDAQHGIH